MNLDLEKLTPELDEMLANVRASMLSNLRHISMSGCLTGQEDDYMLLKAVLAITTRSFAPRSLAGIQLLHHLENFI